MKLDNLIKANVTVMISMVFCLSLMTPIGVIGILASEGNIFIIISSIILIVIGSIDIYLMTIILNKFKILNVLTKILGEK